MIAEGDPRRLRDESTESHRARVLPPRGAGSPNGRRLMRGSRRHSCASGLLIARAAIGARWSASCCSSAATGSAQGAPFETYFRESVQGLEVGAPVQVTAASRIGRVTEIGLVSAELRPGRAARDCSARPTGWCSSAFSISPSRVGRLPDTETAVRAGLRARVASQGITGLSYIELDFVDPSQYPPQNRALDAARRIHPFHAQHVHPGAGRRAAVPRQAQPGRHRRARRSRLIGLRRRPSARPRGRRRPPTLSRADRTPRHAAPDRQVADLPELTADLRNTSGSVRDLVQGKELRTLLANLTTAADRLSVAAGKLPALLVGLEATPGAPAAARPTIQQSLASRCCATCRRPPPTCARRRRRSANIRAQVLLGGPPPRERGGEAPPRARRFAALAGCGSRSGPIEWRQWPLIVRRPARCRPRARPRAARPHHPRRTGLEARGLQSACSRTAASGWISTRNGPCRPRRAWRTICAMARGQRPVAAVLAPRQPVAGDSRDRGDLTAFWADLRPCMPGRAQLSCCWTSGPIRSRVLLQRTFTGSDAARLHGPARHRRTR